MQSPISSFYIDLEVVGNKFLEDTSEVGGGDSDTPVHHKDGSINTQLTRGNNSQYEIFHKMRAKLSFLLFYYFMTIF